MPGKVLTLLLIVLFSACKQSIDVLIPDLNLACGIVERYQDFNSDYVSNRNIDIWLPEDFSRNEEYSVLYMHDGQMLFDSTKTWNKQEWGVDETVGRLMREGPL